MFKVLSGSITDSAVKRGAVKPEDREETVYGINTLLNIGVNIISALLIGLIFNMVIELILFLVIYKLLRRYTGGIHANNALNCYISSCITYIAALVCIRYYNVPGSVTTVLILCSSAVLWILAPIEAKNKPLDELERKVFRRRSHIMIIVCFAVFAALHYIPVLKAYSAVAAISIYTVAIFAVLGKISIARYHQKQQNNL